MTGIVERTIETNGIRMHTAEAGTGPLVVLLHGFPEGWYSWRHQFTALVSAGFHVVAPDQRGYGRTDSPESVEAYDIFALTADVVGLIHAVGGGPAVVVGHDWGASVAWHCAQLRPDLFRGVGLLSVPFRPRYWGERRPTEAMRTLGGSGQEFYQLYFQEPGRAEADLGADVRRTMAVLMSLLSGDPPTGERWRGMVETAHGLVGGRATPAVPPWLTEADLDYYVDAFTETGFRGGLNWYRNVDRNWQTTRFLCGAKLTQPSLFMAGEWDPVIDIYRPSYDALRETVPDLRNNVLLPGAGHWVQQERPAEVTQHLLDFLRGL